MEGVGAEVGGDDTGEHGGAVDVRELRAELHAEAAHEEVHGGLRGAVRTALGGEREPREAGGDRDDVAALALAEVREHGLDAVEHRLDVDGHHVVDVGVGELGDHARDAAARVVDDHVELTEALERAIAEPLEIGALGDVGGNDERVRSQRGGARGELGFATGGEHDAAGAALGDLGGERGADADRRAGDDDDLVVHGRTVTRSSGLKH